MVTSSPSQDPPVKRKRGRPKGSTKPKPPGWVRPAHWPRPVEERSPHGFLVSILRSLSFATRRDRPTREKLQAYLASAKFQTAFDALDTPRRKMLALQAVAKAIDTFRPPRPAPTGRVRWNQELNRKLQEAAKRLPDDKSIAEELGLPAPAVKLQRWRLLGRKTVPHVSRAA